MMHQCFIQCHECGDEGYTQTKGEPQFCPVCGASSLEVDLIEFTLYEAGQKKNPPKKKKRLGPKPKKQRVKREETVKEKPPRKKHQFARKQTGPKPGTSLIRVDSLYSEHTKPEELGLPLEIVDVEYREDKNPNRKKGDRGLRPYLILSCGYKGVNSYCPMHLHKIHGMPLAEAKAMCLMENVHKAMAAKGKTEYRTVYVESRITQGGEEIAATVN